MTKGNSVPTPDPFNQNHYEHRWTPVANPAAGAGASIVAPAASHARLFHLTFTMTADANAANRIIWLSLHDGPEIFQLGSSQVAHTANAVVRYICSSLPMLNMGPPDDFFSIPLPDIRSTNTTDTWQINIENIQVGDQISLIRAHWRLWRGLT